MARSGDGQVGDEAAMRVVLQQWMAEDERMLTPAGRWAIELRQDGSLIGGATLLPLPPDDEYEIGWQLQRDAWGHGYATETGRALAAWAFEQGLEQVIAVVRPANMRAIATVRRIGMEWIGETEKYHNLRLQEYRLRPADLAASAQYPPGDRDGWRRPECAADRSIGRSWRELGSGDRASRSLAAGRSTRSTWCGGPPGPGWW